MSGFATIDYDEGKGSTYRGIELHVGQERIRFDSGDPVVDFYRYRESIAQLKLPYVSCSSSFDHYFFDGAKHKGKKVVELYFDRETHKLLTDAEMTFSMLCSDKCFRLWGYKGMKTVEEIQTYVQQQKEPNKK